MFNFLTNTFVQNLHSIVFMLVIGGVAAPGIAQTFYGSIIGTVVDPTDAAVASTTVELTNIGTGEQRSVQTDSAGNYRFSNLLPGQYRIEAEQHGFKHLTRGGIVVEVQSTVRIDLALEIGNVAERMEVTAQTPLLQTEATTLGQVVESRTVAEMPLNARNVLNLAALVPGVVPQGNQANSTMGTPTGVNIFAWGNYQIGGGFANTSASYLDGAPLNVSYINLTTLIPTQDAIQEFRVQTNSLGPEFGRYQGGVINLATKSGTNAFHGSIYEFLRNRVLNANTFFANRGGIERPPFTQNQFGGNIGGPIQRDKMFFFFSYEGFRLRQGTTFSTTVPTVAMQTGDFSDYRSSTGSSILIYDPLTTCGQMGNPACASGQPLRTPFPENRIPINRIDRAANWIRTLWPMPNVQGLQYTNVNNYVRNGSVGGNNDQISARIDRELTTKQRFFTRYTRWSNYNMPIDPFGTGMYIDRPNEWTQTDQAVVAYSYMISPTTLFDLRAAVLRFSFDRAPEVSLGFDLTTLGWPAYMNEQVTWRTYPTAYVSGYSDLFTSAGTGAIINNRSTSYSLAPTLSSVMGRHTVKAGGDLRRLENNHVQTNTATGQYNFSEAFTAVNPQAPAGTGSAWASFLLGYGSGGNLATIARPALRQPYYGFFVSDIFQATQKLTLNYGLRWELPFQSAERFDRAVVFLPDAPSPLAESAGLPNLKGNIALVRSPEWKSRRPYHDHFKLVAPHVGAALRLSDKTVLRMGYGIFFVPVNSGSTAGTSYSNPWLSTGDSSLTPINTLSNPFPDGLILPPQRDYVRLQTLAYGAGTGGSFPNGNERAGYMQQWNVTVQQEWLGTAIEVAYAGAKGTHLGTSEPQNTLPDKFLSLGPQLLQQVPNPFYGLIPVGAWSLRTIQYGNLLRPYPQYSGVNDANGNRSSIYHAMQMKIEHRFRTAGAILGSYTWSKFIANTDTGTGWLENAVAGIQNPNNLNLERSLISHDAPHRAVVSYTIDLSIGKGKMVLGNVSNTMDKIVGGWGIAGYSTFQSGFPLGMTMALPQNGFGIGQRPNADGSYPGLSGSAQSRISQWFCTTCFSAPGQFQLGTVGRTINVRTAGMSNWDFSLFKNTKVTESLGIQFRTEVFNLFNRVQFSGPNTRFGSAQFGVVSEQYNNPRLVQFALRLVF